MKLLFDIGNSRIHWAGWSDGNLFDVGAIPHSNGQIAEELGTRLREFQKPDSVFAGSVGPAQIDETVSSVCHDLWGRDTGFVQVQKEEFGIRVAYDNPAELGVDRWLAMIAASQTDYAPCCIVDCGTAVTIDILGPEGRHSGGFILPGLEMMTGSLTSGASRISTVPQESVSADFPPVCTADAVAAGTVIAVVGAITEALRWAQDSLDQHVSLVMTGGDATIVSGRMTVAHSVIPELVLQGLATVSESNS